MSDSRVPPVCLQDFEDYAREILSYPAFQYCYQYAGEGQTFRDCMEAFKRYRIRPKVMRDVSNRQMNTTILGNSISFPIGVATTGGQKLCHPEGDLATAKAAAKHDTVMIVSNAAMYSIKEVASAAPNVLLWAQLYIFRNRDFTEWYVKKAEEAGAKALVLTCDAPILTRRNVKGLHPRPEYRLGNMNMDDPEVKQSIANGDIALWQYITNQHGEQATWNDVKWLRSITKLPIVAKGILTGESAIEAVEAGVSGIVVSAHGGRQLDGVPATLDALPEVVEAVKGTGVEVYMDGGIRTGTDVFKALALGARTVFIGRPLIWGLAYDGANGASQVLEIIKNEFSTTMALAGCATLKEINSSRVIHESKYLCKL